MQDNTVMSRAQVNITVNHGTEPLIVEQQPASSTYSRHLQYLLVSIQHNHIIQASLITVLWRNIQRLIPWERNNKNRRWQVELTTPTVNEIETTAVGMDPRAPTTDHVLRPSEK